ncbi:MAG: hypothetical protein AB1599_11110, partial [Planctomycetota bacterium]
MDMNQAFVAGNTYTFTVTNPSNIKDTALSQNTLDTAWASVVYQYAVGVVTFTSPAAIASGDTTYENYDITCDNTTLTIDGAHAFASLRLINGCVLAHTANPAAPLNLTVRTHMSVDAASQINLNGLGYLAASGPTPGVTGLGTNEGTGAGHGGTGGLGQISSGAGGSPTADLIKQPVEFGSGGGGSGGSVNSGGKGGGAVKIVVSGGMTVNGIVSADGFIGGEYGDDGGGGGAGGSIWIDTNSLSGSGVIRANGGDGKNGGAGDGGGGGGGRIAVHYSNSSYTGAYQAYGGEGTAAQDGGAGTVYLENKITDLGRGNIVIDNISRNNAAEASTWLDSVRLGGSGAAVDDLSVLGNAFVSFEDDNNYTYRNISLDDGNLRFADGAITVEQAVIL